MDKKNDVVILTTDEYSELVRSLDKINCEYGNLLLEYSLLKEELKKLKNS